MATPSVSVTTLPPVPSVHWGEAPAPFDFVHPRGGVLWGRVLFPGEETYGNAAPDALPDSPPAWLSRASHYRSDSDPKSDLEGLLAGRTPFGASWLGTPLFAARVLTVLDALGGSCSHELPWPALAERHFVRFTPSPGGPLDLLLSVSWRLAVVLAGSALAEPHNRDSGVGLAAVGRALAPVVPVPMWDLGRWSGDPARPPPGSTRSEGLAFPGKRARRIRKYLERAVESLDVRGIQRRTASFVLQRSSVWRMPGGGRLPDESVVIPALLVYQNTACQVLQLVVVALRLCAHVRFLCEICPSLPARSRVDWHNVLVASRVCVDALEYLADQDPAAMHDLFFVLRDELALSPGLLFWADARFAALWDAHAVSALEAVWGVRPGMRDGPDRAGPAPDLVHRVERYDV